MPTSKYLLVSTVFLLVVFFCFNLGCRKGEGPCTTCPPTYVPSIFLDTLSVDVTQILLRVRATDTTGTARLALYRDSVLLYSGKPLRGDTTLLDTGLAVSHLYNYKSYRITQNPGEVRLDSTTLMTLRTRDTTSHNFTWQVETLGDTTSSLYDVAIIDEHNIWVVGWFYLSDSLGPTYSPYYTVAQWDGAMWRFYRLYFFNDACTRPGYYPLMTRAVFTFGANNVWVAGAKFVARWNGTAFINHCPGGSFFNKIWGEHDSSLYVGCNGGSITRYNGSSWQTIQSGVATLDILDIWGSVAESMVERQILCPTSSFFNVRRLYRIRADNTVDTIAGVPGRQLSSVWFQSPWKIFACGDGVFIRGIDETWWEIADTSVIPSNTRRIRGVSPQDVFVVGPSGIVGHFNGLTMHRYTEVFNAEYYSCDYNGRLLVAVGEKNGRAVVLRGVR